MPVAQSSVARLSTRLPTRLCIAILAVSAWLSGSAVHAQSGPYPTKPIKVIVAYPPGGAVDFVARSFSAELGRVLGQPLIIDNRAGAEGAIGMDALIKSAPDGYTLIVSLKGALTVAPTISKLPYDPLKDLKPVAILAETAEIIVANPRLGVKNLVDLRAAFRERQGKISVGYAGAFPRLLTELLAQETRLALLRVPYKGVAPAMQDLLGGQTDLLIGDATGALLEQVRSGKLVALAVTSQKRLAVLPDVPTVAESGYSRMSGPQWYALYGPAAMPASIVTRLEAAVKTALQSAPLREQLAKASLQTSATPSSGLSALMRAETAHWKAVADAAGIRQE